MRHRNTKSVLVNIFDIIKAILQDLLKEEFLSKCLHVQTQNTNEALNAIIWSRCAKNAFLGRRTLEIEVNSAILNFNDSSKSC